MALHLIKLCVGAESIEDLEAWIAECLRLDGEQVHTTRMTPKRRDELLDGGSLYWIIRGKLNCRQRILDLRSSVGADGIGRCDIVLEPVVVRIHPRPRGPFQGWRYLDPKDTPPDLAADSLDDLPADLQKELRLIGLL
jgi:hypothetical protein